MSAVSYLHTKATKYENTNIKNTINKYIYNSLLFRPQFFLQLHYSNSHNTTQANNLQPFFFFFLLYLNCLWLLCRLMGRLFVVNLEGKIYSCKHCHTHLALYDDIYSRVSFSSFPLFSSSFICSNGSSCCVMLFLFP